jgi:hypothetical protein
LDGSIDTQSQLWNTSLSLNYRLVFPKMKVSKIQAWWAHKQGLDGSLAGKTVAQVLERTGWARSVGGASPYLTLYARASISREGVDAAVSRLEACELPSARGCTYVVPASDFGLALKVGQGFGDEAEMKVARKLGVTDAEIDGLCRAIVDALGKGPNDPEELRQAVGGAVRNLGAEGTKRGLTTTLPVALGKLQSAGEIRRISTNGRLDQQRYRYTLWRSKPLAKFELSREEASTELARRFFSWIGPASLAEFQWFSGLGAKGARAAVARLPLVSLTEEEGRLIFPQDRDSFMSFSVPKQPQYVLVSSLDGIMHLRRDVRRLLAAENFERKLFGEKGYQSAGQLSDLPSHAILDRGRLIGLWEYDVVTASIAWITFGSKDKALLEAVKRCERFVRDQLGDARSFSLDSPKSRAPRIEALQKSG